MNNIYLSREHRKFNHVEGGPCAVSVVITLYNYSDYIIDTLKSVARQTANNIELILVNDCSTDNSLEIADNWLSNNNESFGRAAIYDNLHNYGLAVSRNIGISKSSADYVFMLDADNIIYPKALEVLIRSLKSCGASASYSQLEFFGDISGIGDANIWSVNHLKIRNYIDAMALFTREALIEVGCYSSFNVSGWEDYDIWCKFIEHGLHAVFVPQMLCRYRVHGSSMLRKETNEQIEEMRMEFLVRHPWLT